MQTGVIVSNRKPDGSTAMDQGEDDPNAGISAVSQDLIRSIHAKDEAGVSAALRAAFEILSGEEQPEEDESQSFPESGAI